MRHFLVVASSSRVARLFIKKALRNGHDVTAICRESDDKAALMRMEKLLSESTITPAETEINGSCGVLKAISRNILDPSTYSTILKQEPTIDSIFSFVGPSRLRDAMSSSYSIYTNTIKAIINGTAKNRSVEIYYHSSVGVMGIPAKARLELPANYTLIQKIGIHLVPVFRNVVESEKFLGESFNKDLKYIVFRPATLTNRKASRNIGYSFNETSYKNEMLPLSKAKTTISREDVAEEILRVAELSQEAREKYFSNAIYLAEMK